MTACLVCGESQGADLVDFGLQPVCHHFYDGTQPEGMYPIVLGQCQNCGAVQLTRRVSPELLVPRFDWLTYNEPEGHVDQMFEMLRSLPGINPGANICGVSHKDESTLRRFREAGFSNAWRIDPRQDLAITNPREGIETIQSRLKPALASQLGRDHGSPDVIVARHVIEHTHDTHGFMECLRQLVRPGGYVVFEIPECGQPFDLLDYTVLWEDHTLYFDEAGLRTCLELGGFSVERVVSYPAPYETAVVAIARPRDAALSPPAPQTAKSQRARQFAEALGARRLGLRRTLEEWKTRGKIVLFGAGHHAVTFTNIMQIGDLIECVLDDHPQKRGKQLPGSRLPIVGSGYLANPGVNLCLSSLGAGSERKVLEKNAAFSKRGGTFAAIFPTRPGDLVTFLNAGEELSWP